jgi:hypothetical protein
LPHILIVERNHRRFCLCVAFWNATNTASQRERLGTSTERHQRLASTTIVGLRYPRRAPAVKLLKTPRIMTSYASRSAVDSMKKWGRLASPLRSLDEVAQAVALFCVSPARQKLSQRSVQNQARLVDNSEISYHPAEAMQEMAAVHGWHHRFNIVDSDLVPAKGW